jgi:hypothetical protein
VKGLIGPEGWELVIRQYVPEKAYRSLLQKFGGRSPSAGMGN